NVNNDTFKVKSAQQSPILNFVNKIVNFTFEKEKPKGYVALTFDDGPNRENTGRILESLDKYNAKGTFFVIGHNARKFPDILKKAYNFGHEIASHTYNHKNLTKLNEDELRHEIDATNNEIFKAIGKEADIVRAPYGTTDENVLNLVDMPFIHWSIDTMDWKYKNKDIIKSNILNSIKDGSVILMHDIYSSTADAVEEVVEVVDSLGYKMVTVSELAKVKNINLEKEKEFKIFE
ncbi:MAG: polysaccharide deacetylase family protein, partial [Oscillospiraceae bacterium]